MLNYEFGIAIKNRYGLFDPREDANSIILIPEMINDIIAKINRMTIEVPSLGRVSSFNRNIKFGEFKNGYAFLSLEKTQVNIDGVDCFSNSYKILTRYGEIFEIDGSDIDDRDGNNRDFFALQYEMLKRSCNPYVDRINNVDDYIYYLGGTRRLLNTGDIQFLSEFFEDRALCAFGWNIYDKSSEEHSLGYIDAITRKLILIPREIQAKYATPYTNGYARIENCYGEVYFVDKDMHIVTSPEKLNELNAIFRDLHNNGFLQSDATIKRIETKEPKKFIYIDPEFRMNIMTHQVVRKLASYFDLEVPNTDVKRQLIWLISKIAKKGNYVFHFNQNEELNIPEIEKIPDGCLVQAVIIGDGKNIVISDDVKDISFMRERIKKDTK